MTEQPEPAIRAGETKIGPQQGNVRRNRARERADAPRAQIGTP